MRCANCHKPIHRAAATVITTNRAATSMLFTTTENYGPKCAAKLGLLKADWLSEPPKRKSFVSRVFVRSKCAVQDGQVPLFEDVAA